MDKYTRIRIDELLDMMETIAHLSREKAFELMKETITYKYIIEGEQLTLYESYSANLEDIVDEIKENGFGEYVKAITSEAITKYNNSLIEK